MKKKKKGGDFCNTFHFSSSWILFSASHFALQTAHRRIFGIVMLMLSILIKRWQGQPKFKSKQNLISKGYPKRVEE